MSARIKYLLWNSALIVSGLCVMAAVFAAISSVHPLSKGDFDWRMKIASFAALAAGIALFLAVWKVRSKWILQIGIFESPSVTCACLSEGHPVPEEFQTHVSDFRNWLQNRRDNFVDEDEIFDAEAAAIEIHRSTQGAQEKQTLVEGLIAYATNLRSPPID